MVSVFLLVVTIASAYVVVIAGTVAYELTGLDHETAHFQALSAFTGTGFTTRIAERVVNHPVRRRITTTLMLLGYGGTATVVASLATSVGRESFGLDLRNLALMAVAGVLTWFLFRSMGAQRLTDWLRRLLAPRLLEPVPHEELMLYKRGFGISRLEIPPNSPVAGRLLREAGLRELRLQVLAVEAGAEVVAIPEPDWRFEVGQHVVLYGDLAAMRAAFKPEGTDEGLSPRTEEGVPPTHL
ncbi:MAG: TrkA C-terminal domain-containing protein [Myxococcales bacterium]|nr:TrkA C-terminal domain-containing protein [Myxococcales bacterium]